MYVLFVGLYRTAEVIRTDSSPAIANNGLANLLGSRNEFIELRKKIASSTRRFFRLRSNGRFA